MTVSTTVVGQDIGELKDAIDGTTTTLLQRFITKSEDFVKLSTNTTTGFDYPINNYACANAVKHILGGLDGVSKTIGPLQVGKKDLVVLMKEYLAEGNRAMKIKGYSADGHKMIFEMTNL